MGRAVLGCVRVSIVADTKGKTMQKTVAEFTLLRDAAPAADQPSLLWVTSPLQEQVDALESTDISMQEMVDALGAADASRLLGVTTAIAHALQIDPPLTLSSDVQPDKWILLLAERVIQLSGWLADRADEVGEAAILSRLKELELTPEHDVSLDVLRLLHTAVGDAVTALAGQGHASEALAEATRLYLVLALVIDMQAKAGNLSLAAVSLLLGRSVMLPSKYGLLFPEARVPLVRAAAVSDLYLLRSEWRGYVRGEIAALKNVMAKEHLKQESSETRETEDTNVSESTQTSEQETSQETRNSSELSKEVTTALTASLQAGANAEVTGVFPGGTYRVGANAQGSIGVSRAERLATRTAQEAVAKAVSRVASSVRSQRSLRELVRFVNGQEYKLENEGDTHIRGVYRWVDRVERFQIYKIPDRLQLEFQLPQPAEFFKARQRAADAAESKGAPPPWKVTLDMAATDTTLSQIRTQADADKLAADYRASEVPPMPKERLAVTETAAFEAKPVRADTADPVTVLAPVASGKVEIIVPDGYEAVEVEYFLSATPAKGRWVREKGNNSAAHLGFDVTEAHVFHSIVAEAFVGGVAEYVTDWRPEDQALAELFTTQGSDWNRSANFGNAFARSSGIRSFKFVDPAAIPALDAPVRTKLVVGFRSIGASHLQAAIRVHCRRTEEHYSSWRHQAYDALYSAFSRWSRDFESSRNTATMFGQAPTGERPPAKNRRFINEELKRQVIAWLLDESPFSGRGSLKAPGTGEGWRDIAVDKAIANAPTIQFFEQAIDWPNMAWMFYPYYWADRQSDWLNWHRWRRTIPSWRASCARDPRECWCRCASRSRTRSTIG